MKQDAKTLLENAVHVRTWKTLLNRGDKVVIVPGSPDHQRIDAIVEQLDLLLEQIEAKAKPREYLRKKEIAPQSMRLRKMRERRSNRTAGLIGSYFRLWGRPSERTTKTNV